MLRVLRLLRLISAVPRLRFVVEALLHAIPGIASIGVLILIIFYVLPCPTYILPGGAGFEIVIEKPLPNFPTGTPEGDAQRMNSAIEDCIRRDPSQYFWVHKRFKTRPPGETSIYD